MTFRHKIWDAVRIQKRKGIFEKGYTPNWSQQIFKIEKRIPRIPPIYKIKDLLEKTQKGFFDETQLQEVKKEQILFKLDTIFKTKKNWKGLVEKYVSWLGYPEKFNSWVLETDILSGQIKEILPNDQLQSSSGFSIPNSFTFNFKGGNQYIEPN